MQELSVLEFLKETSKENPKSTLEIAKSTFGSKGTKKMINPTLYKMKREGHVDKLTDENGAKPRWYVTPTGRSIITDE